jgi:hypothetical protein
MHIEVLMAFQTLVLLGGEGAEGERFKITKQEDHDTQKLQEQFGFYRHIMSVRIDTVYRTVSPDSQTNLNRVFFLHGAAASRSLYPRFL